MAASGRCAGSTSRPGRPLPVRWILTTTWRRAVAVALVLVALSACAPAGGLPPSDNHAAAAISGSGGSGPDLAGPDATGRIISWNMPDPAVLQVGGTYFMYATQGAARNVQTATSTDLRTWSPGPDALPVLGRWARPGRTWAPEVLATSGGYLLFYTATDRFSGRQCIGRASAAEPAGPFVDRDDAPLVCQRALGGSIDPNPVAADGRVTLYWKNDGNCCGLPVRLWGQQLDGAAGALVGAPVALLAPGRPWQGRLVEAPEMFSRAGHHYLFYAANAFDTSGYAEGVATCATALGPCVDGPGPILTTTPEAIGPGHAFVLAVGQQTVMVFHAWTPDADGRRSRVRSVWLETLSWVDGAPAVDWPPAAPGIPVEALGPPG